MKSLILLVLTARILPLGDILSSLVRVDVAWIALALLYILSSLMSFIALCYLVMNMAHTPLVRNHRTVAAMGLFLLITVFKSWLDGLVFDSVLLQQEGMNAQAFFASFSGYAQPAWMVIGWEFLWVVLFTAAGVWILKHQMEIE